ncbi:LOW QUALITY PROTEIN: syntaxin-binding protein 4 [Pelodytes ibericus]
MANYTEISKCPTQLITVTKQTSLGLSLIVGNSRTEGALIYIKDIIPGGDCHKDGRLKPGDQLVSVNNELLHNVSCEEAKSILNRAKLRGGSFWEIAYIRPEQGLQEQGEHIQGTADFTPKISSNPSAVKCGVPVKDGIRNQQTPKVMPFNSAPFSPNQGQSQEKAITLNPNARFKVEKLELALNYLGLNPTEEQKQSIRQHLQMDTNGTVSFRDFVQVTRNLFSLQINQGVIGRDPLMLRENDITSLLSQVSSQVQSCDLSDSSDVEKNKAERNEAYMELKKLKDCLLESEKQKCQLSEELKSVKQEAKAAIEEARSLRSRIHLAEVAQRQACGMEMDYEEVIRLLEAEITELRAQLVDHSGPSKDSTQDLKRRITVLGCQLRKSEMARKTFEVSTEKLLQFVEHVPEILAEDMSSTLNLCERIHTFPSPVSKLGPNRCGVLTALAAEAKDLARSVRSIVEVDCLPYGWEEAYTADGIKYFINHVTQTTSWTHPVTGALSLTGPEDIGEEHHRDPPVLKSC